MTDRPRMETKRVLRILSFVIYHGPVTQRQIADEIEGKEHDTSTSNLYLDLTTMEDEGFITITKDDKRSVRYIAACVPSPHRGGVEVFLGEGK